MILIILIKDYKFILNSLKIKVNISTHFFIYFNFFFTKILLGIIEVSKKNLETFTVKWIKKLIVLGVG